MSPRGNAENASGAFLIDSYGSTSLYNTYHAYAVYPVVYLKPYVSITSGTGTSSDPYILTN